MSVIRSRPVLAALPWTQRAGSAGIRNGPSGQPSLVAATRSIRVTALLTAIWVISVFDYLHTVLAVRAGLADECNPLALAVLQHGDGALLVFKLGLVACGTAGMFLHRRRALTEWLSAIVAAALVFVALRWMDLYELYALIDRFTPPGYRVHGGGL